MKIIKRYMLISCMLINNMIQVTNTNLLQDRHISVVAYKQSINDLLVEAVVQKQIEHVKKYIALGATNLDIALKIAETTNQIDQNSIKIIALLKKEIKDKPSFILSNITNGVAMMCAGIVMIQAISYLHDKYLQMLDVQPCAYKEELENLLQKKDRGETDYEGKRSEYDACEIYDEYKIQIAALVNNGIHPNSEEDKAKVARILMSLKQEDMILEQEMYKHVLSAEKDRYDKTEFLFKQYLQKKDQSKLTPTEEICLKYMQEKPGLLYAWVTRFDAHKHATINDVNCAKETMFQDFVKVMKSVSGHEREFISQGYIPFSHGRRWEFNFLSEVYNFIEAIDNNCFEMSDEIKMRYRAPDCDVEELKQWRKELVNNGVYNHSESAVKSSGKDSEITYLARTPLSNASLVGENPLRLFLTNFSYARKPIVLMLAKELLKKKKLSHYESDIEDLFNEHEKSNIKGYGDLLTIGIKQEEVNNIVYTSTPRGYKYKGASRPYTALENVQHCQQEVKNDCRSLDTDGDFCIHCHNYDARMACAACLTLPNEHSNKYKIKSTNLADQNKLQEIKQKFEDLLRKAKKL